ncbi:helix-turn-helix domain-containing protein [Actinomycetes bacterium KLBMP 9797]
MTGSRLLALVGTTLRRQRELHGLTQQQLATLAGISQSTVVRIERGDRWPSHTVLERLFAALGSQLTIGTEPLDAQLDSAIAELEKTPLAERIADTEIERVAAAFPDIPYVFDGPAAALLQGAPLPADAVDLAVRWRDADTLTAWLDSKYAHRWNERWQQFGFLRTDPREPGAHRWRTMLGEIRLRMCDDLPESIEVRHGDRGYRVVPLAALQVDDPRTADMLRHYRARSPLIMEGHP